MIKEKITNFFKIIFSVIIICLFLNILNYYLPFYDNFVIITLVILIIIFSAYLNLIIHELGHFIFGKLTGYNLISFRIGSFSLVRNGEKIELKRYTIPGTEGQCLMDPPDLDENNDYPVILYNFGGSLMNIIISFIFYIIFLLTKEIPLINVFCLSMIFIGMYLAILNGIPMKNNDLANDGYNGVFLNKDKYAKKAFWCQLRITKEMSLGKRLGSIDENLFNIDSKGNRNNHHITTIDIFKINRLMDQHKFEEAKIEIIELLSNPEINILGVHEFLLTIDLLYIDLMNGSTREEINETIYKDFNSFLCRSKYMLAAIRFEYTYELLINDNKYRSVDYINKFNKIEKTYPYRGEVEMEKELIFLANEKYKSK